MNELIDICGHNTLILVHCWDIRTHFSNLLFCHDSNVNLFIKTKFSLKEHKMVPHTLFLFAIFLESVLVPSSVLAQRGFLKEKEFVNYLEYLQYWKKQEYAVYLRQVPSK